MGGKKKIIHQRGTMEGSYDYTLGEKKKTLVSIFCDSEPVYVVFDLPNVVRLLFLEGHLIFLFFFVYYIHSNECLLLGAIVSDYCGQM